MPLKSRSPPTEAAPAYRYLTRFYRRDLKPVVIAMSLLTAIWALAWTVSSFEELHVADSNNLPKLAPLAITQGVMFAVAFVFQVFGVVAAITKRLALIRIYAFLCTFSTLLVIGVGVVRVIVHSMFKSDLIDECITVAQTGSIGSVFGLWNLGPDNYLDKNEAKKYCYNKWTRDSWVEIVALALEILLGLLFTALAFAYYRQSSDPASPANTSRLPFHARRDGRPSNRKPPHDGPVYVPVYLPPPGSPRSPGGKLPKSKLSSCLSSGEDLSSFKGDGPLTEVGAPSVPMPTHQVENRGATSPPNV